VKPFTTFSKMTPTMRRVLQALLYEAIAIAFTWCFDRVFGLPVSAQVGHVP
jgi:uncharacterized membrane protein